MNRGPGRNCEGVLAPQQGAAGRDSGRSIARRAAAPLTSSPPKEGRDKRGKILFPDSCPPAAARKVAASR
jgi:hypothetical protein